MTLSTCLQLQECAEASKHQFQVPAFGRQLPSSYWGEISHHCDGFSVFCENGVPCYLLTVSLRKLCVRMNRIPNLPHFVLNFCRHDPNVILFCDKSHKDPPYLYASNYAPRLCRDSDVVSQGALQTPTGGVPFPLTSLHSLIWFTCTRWSCVWSYWSKRTSASWSELSLYRVQCWSLFTWPLRQDAFKGIIT